MTGHCDADVLAEFREGLLGRHRTARISAHLAGCSRCAALSSGLAEVTALLANAPVPRMPDELTARLDGVLAAESAARARAGTPAAAGDARAAPDGHRAARGAARRRIGRPPPGRPARPRPWRATALRAASVTAAVLVIAGGGYGVSRLLQGGANGTSSSAASRPGIHRPGAGPSQGGGSAPPNMRMPAGGLRVVHSGTNYLPGRLAAQAEAALALYVITFAGGKTQPATALPPAGLQGCVQRVTGGPRVSLVDVAQYRGRPAIVIIQAAASRQPGQVWVVGPGCSARSPDLIARAPLPGTG